jgi:sugar phosphate isomerase/epimerase
MTRFSRRTFTKTLGASVAAAAAGSLLPVTAKEASAAGQGGEAEPFRLNYLLASSLYGKVHIRDIVPQVAKAGCDALDVWCPDRVPHRTQVDEMGHDAFAALLKEHKTRLGAISPYNKGPFGLADELRLIAKLGGTLAIAGSQGPADDVKAAMKDFIERLKPQVEVAEEVGVDIGIENHGSALLWKPDSFRYFCEFAASPRLKISFAPFHLPQESETIAGLLREIGPKLAHIYMWQQPGNRKDTGTALPALPGPGGLDFVPIVAALKAIRFTGWSEIFTHAHVHNGAMCETTEAVTAKVVEAREYLEACLAKA